MANLALLEWPENIDISDKPPVQYVKQIRKRFEEQDGLWTRMLSDHALPINWETMAYQDFLGERRKLMAALIRRGFESLA